MARLHHDLGRFFVEAVRSGLGRSRVDLVGVHGQTVFHGPEGSHPATLQIGEPAWLAAELRKPVVGNFRVGDLAVGGQGAPLATLFHREVFGRRGEHVCVNNLGGISNVTSLDGRRALGFRVLAFDTGPANMLIDLGARHYLGGRQAFDRGGRGAAAGVACEALLRGWMRHPFFAAPPPKSTGREVFGEAFFRRALGAMEARRLGNADGLCTLTELTVRSIAVNYERHVPQGIDRVILTGGGAANQYLVKRLGEVLSEVAPGVEVTTAESWGWPLQAIEPAAFALLAWRRWHRLPGNLPGTTGARRAALCGQVVMP